MSAFTGQRILQTNESKQSDPTYRPFDRPFDGPKAGAQQEERVVQKTDRNESSLFVKGWFP